MMTETLLIVIFVALLVIVIAAYLVGVIIPAISGAIYAGSSMKVVRAMVDISRIKEGEKVADLGSGDGRVVIAFAKQGAEAHGFEINPMLIWFSRRRIKKEGLQNKAFIHQRSFWGADCSDFDVVTVFGITHIMKKLEKKLFKELKPGARVVVNAFEFPNKKYTAEKDGAYLYIKE